MFRPAYFLLIHLWGRPQEGKTAIAWKALHIYQTGLILFLMDIAHLLTRVRTPPIIPPWLSNFQLLHGLEPMKSSVTVPETDFVLPYWRGPSLFESNRPHVLQPPSLVPTSSYEKLSSCLGKNNNCTVVMGKARPHWVPQSPGVLILPTALTSAFTLNVAEGIQQKAHTLVFTLNAA
jgi:hypothetical protein